MLRASISCSARRPQIAPRARSAKVDRCQWKVPQSPVAQRAIHTRHCARGVESSRSYRVPSPELVHQRYTGASGAICGAVAHDAQLDRGIKTHPAPPTCGVWISQESIGTCFYVACRAGLPSLRGRGKYKTRLFHY